MTTPCKSVSPSGLALQPHPGAPGKARQSAPRRAELLRARGERLRELAAIDEALADLEEQAERAAPTGWISQRESPLGKRHHLEVWRRLRDQGVDGVKASGYARLIRADVFAAVLDDAQSTRRRRPAEAPTESGVDLAAAFGVEP